jgi:hypothetical protein
MNERKRQLFFTRMIVGFVKKKNSLNLTFFLLYDKLRKIATVLIKRGLFNLCEGGARCIAIVIG